MQLASSDPLAAETRQLQPSALLVRLDTIARLQRQLRVSPVKAESTKQRWDKVLVKIVRLASIRPKPRNLVAIIVNKTLTVTKSDKPAQLVAKLVSCIYPLTALPPRNSVYHFYLPYRDTNTDLLRFFFLPL